MSLIRDVPHVDVLIFIVVPSHKTEEIIKHYNEQDNLALSRTASGCAKK